MTAKRPKRSRGRPTTASSGFHIVAVPNANPDARRLGRALLALVLHDVKAEQPLKEDSPPEIPDAVA